MQEDLTNLILRLLHENPDIHYYQGLHDIVVTFMLEVGARMAYSIMAVLVHHHIRYVCKVVTVPIHSKRPMIEN